jgi:hypothetical protein
MYNNNNNNKFERTEDVKTIADCCLYINPFPTKKIKNIESEPTSKTIAAS